jgi:acyl carrier protein
MTISSRTPEGLPHRCPVCDEVAAVEPSYPGGDATCPRCGQLLWWFRDSFSRRTGIDPGRVDLHSVFAADLGLDSLDAVELMMELEEKFGVTIPDEEAENIRTVEDAIRYLRRFVDGEAAEG